METMKNILLITCLFLLCACGEYQLEQEENGTTGETENEVSYTLQLNIGSQDNAKLNYPLSLFLFDDKNNCVAQENIPDENSEYSSSMPIHNGPIVGADGQQLFVSARNHPRQLHHATEQQLLG